MIGDSHPHAANGNPNNYDWRNEIDEIKKLGINIYSVQALYNGYHLYLDQFQYITDIFVAICLKHYSNERLVEYEQEVTNKLGTIKSAQSF